MENVFQVHIALPCHENWNAMNPEKNGRFCGSCAQTVIDFTQLSDTETLDMIRHAGNGCCGRFATTQLQRPMEGRSMKPIPFKVPAFTASALTAFLLLQALPEAHAQRVDKVLVSKATDTPVNTGLEGASPDNGSYVLGKIAPYRLLSGTVVDARGKPLSGIVIRVKGQQVSGNSNKSGHFYLRLPLTVTMDQPLTLYLSDVHNGLQTLEITLRRAGAALKIGYHPASSSAI